MTLVQKTFPDARKNGAGWTARCPAHDDTRASLSIGFGDDGRMLLHCHAGCDFDDILAAAHLDHADLYPDTTTTKPRIVRVYDYKDQAGALLPTEGDMRSKQL